MKILHLSTNDLRGGASKSMYRLHRQFQDEGFTSEVGCFHKQSNDLTVTKLEWRYRFSTKVEVHLRQRRIEKRKQRFLSNRPKNVEMFSDFETTFPHGLLNPYLNEFDVINLHWINGFLDLKKFFRIVGAKVPVVWRLSDMNPLTGGCHYDMGCGRFAVGCGNCPQLSDSGRNDFSKVAFERQRKVFELLSDRSIFFILQSQWMGKLLEDHPFLSKFPKAIIPNGIDVNLFDEAESLDLGNDSRNDKIKLLMVAGALSDRRKGGAILSDALSRLPSEVKQKIHLLSVGVGECSIEDPLIQCSFLGKIDNYQKLASVFKATDVVLIPSLQDNLPSSVLEAMAGKSAIIASNVGGIPDMIRDGIDGVLYPAESADSLALAICDIVSSPQKRESMQLSAYDRVRREFTLSQQSLKYIELYRRLIQERK